MGTLYITKGTIVHMYTKIMYTRNIFDVHKHEVHKIKHKCKFIAKTLQNNSCIAFMFYFVYIMFVYTKILHVYIILV